VVVACCQGYQCETRRVTVTYSTSTDGLTADALTGFFVGWPAPPAPTTRVEILQRSGQVVLARDGGALVGFVTAITDGVLSAYIPLLEVVPAYQGRGIGTELVRRVLAALDGLYMVDTACDQNLVGFYQRLGFERSNAMIRRDYAAQGGRAGSLTP